MGREMGMKSWDGGKGSSLAGTLPVRASLCARRVQGPRPFAAELSKPGVSGVERHI